MLWNFRLILPPKYCFESKKLSGRGCDQIDGFLTNMGCLAVYRTCCESYCFPCFADLESLGNVQGTSKQKVPAPVGSSQGLTSPEPRNQEASGRTWFFVGRHKNSRGGRHFQVCSCQSTTAGLSVPSYVPEYCLLMIAPILFVLDQ